MGRNGEAAFVGDWLRLLRDRMVTGFTMESGFPPNPLLRSFVFLDPLGFLARLSLHDSPRWGEEKKPLWEMRGA